MVINYTDQQFLFHDERQSSPGVNCRGFLKRAAQPSKALEIELVKKLSNMTFREGFLIFPQASNGCKEIKMYFFH